VSGRVDDRERDEVPCAGLVVMPVPIGGRQVSKQSGCSSVEHVSTVGANVLVTEVREVVENGRNG
jgi:hypothetical protein